jgi:hypothetical protein
LIEKGLSTYEETESLVNKKLAEHNTQALKVQHPIPHSTPHNTSTLAIISAADP